MTSQEAAEKGYYFTGGFSHDKAVMEIEMKLLQERGKEAVMTEVAPNKRNGNKSGYAIWSKI